MYKNWIGIIGNVGPEADEILQRYIRFEMKKRGALNDQDYLPMLVVKNPNISDRTQAIFHDGISPAVGIVETCKILEKNNVYYAALPSNTSHYFFDEFQRQTEVYIVNLIDITSQYLASIGAKKTGILCTTPTKKTGIYTASLEKFNIVPCYPPDDLQEYNVQDVIYGTPYGTEHHQRKNDGLKSGNNTDTVQKISVAIHNLINQQNCQSILLGCTEIPTILPILQNLFPECHFIDTMEILALKMIEIYEEVNKQLLKPSSDSHAVVTLQSIKSTYDIARYVIQKIHKSFECV